MVDRNKREILEAWSRLGRIGRKPAILLFCAGGLMVGTYQAGAATTAASDPVASPVTSIQSASDFAGTMDPGLSTGLFGLDGPSLVDQLIVAAEKSLPGKKPAQPVKKQRETLWQRLVLAMEVATGNFQNLAKSPPDERAQNAENPQQSEHSSKKKCDEGAHKEQLTKLDALDDKSADTDANTPDTNDGEAADQKPEPSKKRKRARRSFFSF